jgi:hypothetical protein
MESLKPITDFFTAIEKDARISVTHIAVYTAVWRYWQLSPGGTSSFRVYSYEIMRLAKISARTTYCKAMTELSQYGYLCYESSYKRTEASLVRLFI